jgi:DNA-binding NarL/FixJ family response regulator
MTAATVDLTLTEREQHILVGLAAGRPYHEIAHELRRNADVIRSQAVRLFRKVGARNAAHLVHIAHQHGLLGGGE